MARGDYIDVTYRTGAGTETKRVQAKTAGATVEVSGLSGREDFITVEALGADARKTPVETARFAKGEVVAIIEGHAPVVVPAPRKASK